MSDPNRTTCCREMVGYMNQRAWCYGCGQEVQRVFATVERVWVPILRRKAGPPLSGRPVRSGGILAEQGSLL